MNRGIMFLAATLAALGAWAAGAAAEEAATKENLAACKLPHDQVLLADRNTPESKTACILHLSDGSMSPWPNVEAKGLKSGEEVLNFLRSEKQGDLVYSGLSEGTFIAVSGRISDEGLHLLSDLSGHKFDRPPVALSQKERSPAGVPTPGVMEGFQDGHCYLVETVDGKFALVRLVQKRGRYALIQYVYQPNGAAAFEIPRGGTIKVEPPRVPPNIVAPPPAAVPGKVTDIHTLMDIRVKLIAELMAVVAKPATTDTEILGKADAVRTLGRLRAAEAAPLLVQEIDFRNPYEPTLEMRVDSPYPCVAALQSIGKPGSLAALAAVGNLRLDGLAPEDAQKAKFRLKLLVMVIKGVEGPDVAAYMIRSKAAQATGPAKAALDAAMKEP